MSDAALSLLRRCLSGESPPVSEYRDTYRELAREGLMIPVSGFTSGPEAFYRLTDRAGLSNFPQKLSRALADRQFRIGRVLHGIVVSALGLSMLVGNHAVDSVPEPRVAPCVKR